MRKTIASMSALAGLGLLFGTLATSTGCYQGVQPWPSVDEVKAVRVLEQPDPRTLEIYGHVEARRTVAPADWRQAEEMTIENLKAAALRRFPNTAVLFEVHVFAADDSNSYTASGIAARRRGQ